jgi:hypothetical protein
MNGGVEVQLHALLTSTLDGGKWSASCLSHFTPDTNRIGGVVDPRVGLDVVVKRKNPSLPLLGI